MFETIKRIFNPPPAPAIIDIAVGDGGEYLIGFCRVQTASGVISLGYYAGPPSHTKYPTCGPTVMVGSHRISVPRQDGESLDAAIARLPLVRLTHKLHIPGRVSVGGHELQFTDDLPGQWDGETKYEGDQKRSDDELLDGGLWGGGK